MKGWTSREYLLVIVVVNDNVREEDQKQIFSFIRQSFWMLNEQIASASSKLVQFIQDLAKNIQRFVTSEDPIEHAQNLLQLRSDYARQLASLFDLLINQYLEQPLTPLHLDPVQSWRSIQTSIDELHHLESPCLSTILNHLRSINGYFYNLLCHLQVKFEGLKMDQIRLFHRNLLDEINGLAETLLTLPLAPVETKETYLFQPAPPLQTCPTNNNSSQNETQEPASNSNCYSCQPRCSPPPNRYSTINLCPPSPCSNKPMGCGLGSGRIEAPPPLCFPTPIVYTPEMETLFAAGGIIYVRKSGNTWVAENLGTLVETLKDIGEKLDQNDYCEILVRKTGDLIVRRKRGRRKRTLQETNTKGTPRANNAYEGTDLEEGEDDDDDETEAEDFIHYENE